MRKDVRQVAGKTVVNQAGKGVCTLVMALFLLGAGPAAHAFPITPLDLTDLDANDRPQGWTYAIQGTTPVPVVTLADDKDYLEIMRDASGGVTAGMFWDGSEVEGDGWLSGAYSGSVVLRFTANTGNFGGVVIGAQQKTYASGTTDNYQGYHLGVVPVGATGSPRGMGVFDNPTTGVTRTSDISVAWAGFTPNSNLGSGTSYLLEFDVSGTTLSAQLWSLDADDDKVSQISSLSYDAAPGNLDGYFGLMGGRFSSDGRGVRFRDVALIPEPGSVFLFLAGGLSLGVLRRRLPRA